MAKINLSNIEKVYDKKVSAVQNFNLEVEDKEFIVFVGPSGCGKSTTLRMIAGLEEITSGDFLIDGKRMNDIPPKDRDIAMVFQNYALYPHMDVYSNMAFGLKLRKFDKKEIDRRVKEAAKILGLEGYLKRKPKALSGGQRQRVALGRAIVRDAKVFLMDEPLSNLDAKLRVQMRAEIQKLHKRLQTTTIYVTHDQTEAMTMASRLVVMKDGIVQQVGAPKEVYDCPNNVFVGGFIGSPSMNFFHGRITDDGFVIGDFRFKLPEAKLKQLSRLGYREKDVIMGIRPEAIEKEEQIAPNKSDTSFPVTVDVAELMGAETYLYSSLGEQTFIARIDAKFSIQGGDQLNLSFDMEQVLFFDQDSEDRIHLDAEVASATG
ncbi:sn-glycerol-3-phosphate ABC transporter ATP-binding protein UgpC [Sediminibacillus dalangtanensis]|uniref:Sn-glycerol-3-phosphate ABC transporter ATP-binding protein UgpC n=1 Tax=Sediminibacillus dalangtanensis TaxID=2729421 RepID=A0ABX7VX64_9BACI|nr:sn-glycerol-3-phosphate ABC transporter ATP-binding protein UgpC [Sediminibacillus dalangtanensis]QTN00615.1 sn-glycerol-3-phosphate ABC transporter ATP-binding protein UgpC [Sediminibacillus dalangtanensis]